MVVLSEKATEPSGSRVLLEEVGHWVMTLKLYKPAQLLVHSLLPVCRGKVTSIILLQPLCLSHQKRIYVLEL